MKILLVTGIYPPDVGGPATFIPQLAQALVEKGHICKVLTLSDTKIIENNDKLFKVIRVKRKTPLLLRFIMNVGIIAVHILFGYRIFANGLHEECGIALSFTGGKGVAKIVGDPIWERATNSLSTSLNLQEFNSKKIKMTYRAQRKLLKFALNNFGTIITPSLELQKIVRKWGVNKRILFIPNGVSSKKLETNEKIYDVITVSRLVSWKNVDILVDSANKYGFSLCIIGDGPELEKIKAKATNNDKIILKGRLNQDQVDELLKQSRLFALISDYEGLSFALLQAMSFGLPVFVSNVPGNSFVVSKSKNGVATSNSNAENIGREISKLLLNVKMLEVYSTNSLISVRDFFNIELCLEKTIEAVEA